MNNSNTTIQQLIESGDRKNISTAVSLAKKEHIPQEEILKPWQPIIDVVQEDIHFEKPIETFEDYLFEIVHLTTLNFAWLKLKSIPPITWKLKNIRELDLAHNSLKSIPEEICTLEKLEILELHSNQLTTLPQNIHKLTNLKELSLFENKLPATEKERIQKKLPNTIIFFR